MGSVKSYTSAIIDLGTSFLSNMHETTLQDQSVRPSESYRGKKIHKQWIKQKVTHACCCSLANNLVLSAAVLVQPSPSPAFFLSAWLTKQLATCNNWQTINAFHHFYAIPLAFHNQWHHAQITLNPLNIHVRNLHLKSLINENIWTARVIVSFWPWLGKRPPDVSILASNIAE